MPLLDLTPTFRALRNRNYRLFFVGQSVSLAGTWMQQMALSWLLYRMTSSAFLLGVSGFIGQIPTFLFAPVAGVIADHYNRHKLLIVTQTLAMVQAIVLTWLVLENIIEVWHILVLILVSGIINAFDIPLRQTFTLDMIEDKNDLSNAIALNSSMVNMAKLIGPSIAGLIIVVAGEGVCFLLNVVSYVAILVALCLMRIRKTKKITDTKNLFIQLKEGFAYAVHFVPIRYLILLLGLVSLAGGSFQTLMPVFAKDLFLGGPKTLGWLLAASGLGALCGAMYLASRRSVVGLVRIIPRMAALLGTGMIAFTFSKSFFLSLCLVFISGFGLMVQIAASNTVLQIIVDEDKRGRIMSFYTMALMGTAPLGSLLAGSVAEKLGVNFILLIGGIGCVGGALFFTTKLDLLRKSIRPIYIQKGILPQVAEGIQTATIVENLPKG